MPDESFDAVARMSSVAQPPCAAKATRAAAAGTVWVTRIGHFLRVRAPKTPAMATQERKKVAIAGPCSSTLTLQIRPAAITHYRDRH